MITQSGLDSDRLDSKPGLRVVRGQARNLLTSNRGYVTVRCVLVGRPHLLILIVPTNDILAR